MNPLGELPGPSGAPLGAANPPDNGQPVDRRGLEPGRRRLKRGRLVAAGELERAPALAAEADPVVDAEVERPRRVGAVRVLDVRPGVPADRRRQDHPGTPSGARQGHPETNAFLPV